MKRYSAYKQTEYDWVPEVPEHWIKKSIREITQLSDRRNGDRTDLELLSLYRDYGVIPKSSRDDNHNVESEDLSKYRHVKKHNLVINKMKAWQGSLGISDYEGIVSPAYIVCDIVDTVHSLYFHHLLRSKPFKTFYNRISYGVRVGQWDMNYEDFKTLHIYLPPLDEQKAIADFLDKKTKQIDRFISLQKEAISLLKELRQAEITKAVTKGLDENAEMKDSGVEWIGEIPEKWGVIPLKYLCDMHAGKSLSSEKILDEGKYSVYGGNGLRGFYTEYNTSGNVLLVGRQGALCGNVHRVCGDFWATEHAVVTNCSSLTDRDYLYYLLIGMNLNQYSSDAAAQPGLSVADIINVRTCFVPLHEQKEIASYLDKKCAEIDSAIQNKEALIEKVTEYKIRLISDAVTGNIDVRGEDIKP